MKIYNKLVRDRIPEIIARSGGKCETRSLGEDEHRDFLRKKLSEEVKEYLESGEMVELADIMEVVYALAEADGGDVAGLEAVRRCKADERGGFHKRILLLSADDDGYKG